MKYLVLILLIVTSISCKDKGSRESERKQDNNKPAQEIVDGLFKTQTFSSIEWGMGFNYPENFEVYKGKLSPNSPVINIYPSSSGATPPLGIHEEAEMTYIAFIPNGFGVDGPAGKRISVREWEGGLPIIFNIDEENSSVYLLENKEPWGFLLKFHQAPEKWNSRGSIFIRLGVKDFRAVCEDKKDGREIAMMDCDPLAGDVVKFFGEVLQEKKEVVNGILRSLYFFSEKSRDENPQDMLEVEEPSKNSAISSPLKIKGKAKGYWFFEAEAPVELVDKNYNLLGRGSITATEEWMTEDFVSFEGSFEFEKPSAKKGYLILKRSNASGMPEHDSAHHIPVLFK